MLLAFVTALALWPILLGCGGEGGVSGEEQSSSAETTSEEERFSAANLQELDSNIAGVMEDKNLPGVLVGVSVPGQANTLASKARQT